MVRRRSNRVICLIWERMNYAQKRAVYRLSTGRICSFSERILNIWWFNLPEEERDLVIDTLVEFIDDKK